MLPEGGLHIVHRTQGNYVEAPVCGHGFDSIGPDLGGEAEGSDDFAEKGGLFVLGFGEGDLNFRVEERNGQAGEASSGAEVEESAGVWVEVLGGEEAFAEVAADDLFRVADGGEVGAGVPLEEEIEIDGELGRRSAGGFRVDRVRRRRSRFGEGGMESGIAGWISGSCGSISDVEHLRGNEASGYGGVDGAGGPGGGFGDESVEERSGGGADVVAALRVPLDAEDEVWASAPSVAWPPSTASMTASCGQRAETRRPSPGMPMA